MHAIAYFLVAAVVTVPVPDSSRWGEVEDPDFARATAGLVPFTPETRYLLGWGWGALPR
jgi:hypothetical protein